MRLPWPALGRSATVGGGGGATENNWMTTFKINADGFGKALLFLNVLLDVQYNTRYMPPSEADDLQCRHILVCSFDSPSYMQIYRAYLKFLEETAGVSSHHQNRNKVSYQYMAANT
jgi:hypothetical protein